MKHKNNWDKLKGDAKKQKVMNKLMAKTEKEKPMASEKGTLWGAKKQKMQKE